MSTLKNMRLFFHRFFLKKQLKNQPAAANRSSVCFEEAKTVGILFNAGNLDMRNDLLRYAKSLKDKGKRVHLLGFFDDSGPTNENFTFKHFSRRNMDWALRPNGEAVEEFIKKPFDVLLNLEPETKIHSEYIAAMSRARLKVGPCTENTYCYDLMIDTADKTDLPKFIREIERVLEKTNIGHEAAQV